MRNLNRGQPQIPGEIGLSLAKMKYPGYISQLTTVKILYGEKSANKGFFISALDFKSKYFQ
jgi:hypothetical protein